MPAKESVAGAGQRPVSGTGVLQAAWRADRLLLGTTAEPIMFGEMLILASPPLPTFEPGLHRVTLDVTGPAPSFTIPTMTYFVTGEEFEDFRKRIEKRS